MSKRINHLKSSGVVAEERAKEYSRKIFKEG